MKTWDLPALTASELFNLAENASKHELGLGDAVELFAEARKLGCERSVPEQYRSSFFLGYFNDVFSLEQDQALSKRVFVAMLALTRAGEPIYVGTRAIAHFDDRGFFRTAQGPNDERDPALCLWRGCYDVGKLAERYESSGRKNQDLEKTIRSRVRSNLDDLEFASESDLAPPLRARAYLERFAMTRFAAPWIEGLDASRDKLQAWLEKASNLGLAKPDEAWRALWSLLPRAEVDQRSQYTARYKEAVLARFNRGSASSPAPPASEASFLVPIDEGERDRMLNSWRAMRADDELALGQPSAALPLAREAWDRDPMDENLALLYAEALLADQATGELKVFLDKTAEMPYANSPRFQRAIAEASK